MARARARGLARVLAGAASRGTAAGLAVLSLAACSAAARGTLTRTHSAPAGAAATPAPAHLLIDVYPHGVGHPGKRAYRLSCNPARGSVPHPRRACRELSRAPHPFARIAPGTFCTSIYLGPQEALVNGVLKGESLRARLNLRGGCQISRWRTVREVVPGFPGP